MQAKRFGGPVLQSIRRVRTSQQWGSDMSDVKALGNVRETTTVVPTLMRDGTMAGGHLLGVVMVHAGHRRMVRLQATRIGAPQPSDSAVGKPQPSDSAGDEISCASRTYRYPATGTRARARSRSLDAPGPSPACPPAATGGAG
eukprot:1102457-Prorocentrum_minimum.AAC.1